MRTAEWVLINIVHKDLLWDEYVLLIQQYGKQCAELALKDASEKQLLGKTATSIVKEILTTQIITL